MLILKKKKSFPPWILFCIEQCKIQKSKLFLLIGLLIALEAARYYSFHFKKLKNQLVQTELKLDALKQQQTSLIEYQLNPETFKNRSIALQKSMKEIENAMPKEWKPESISLAVNQSLQSSGMSLVRQVSKEKAIFEYYEEIEIYLELEGTYQAWSLFFENSKQWNFLSTARHLEILSIGGKNPLKVKYQFAIFRRVF